MGYCLTGTDPNTISFNFDRGDMSAQVVQLKPLVYSGWSSCELGEFYRVEAALIKAGLRIETSCGLSDKGDAWFVFCRADDGEVIVHIARIDGIYILASASYAGVASGRSITVMVRDLLEKHPLVQMSGQGRGCKIFLHPVALLVAVVAAAFFKSSEARALTSNHLKMGDTRGEAASVEPCSTSEPQKTIDIDAGQGAVVLSAMLTALSHEITSTDKAISTANADFLTSFFVDSSGFSTAVTHATDLVLNPQNLHGDGAYNFPPVEPFPTAHSEAMAEALPLFTLLWDLTKTATPAATFADGIGQSSSSGQGPTDVDSLILSVTFAPSPGDGALPAVYSASLSASLHSDADSHASSVVATTTVVVETSTPSQLDPLSSALINALKATSHTLIPIPESGTTPFATALLNFLTHRDPTNAGSSSDQADSTSPNATSTEPHSNDQADSTSPNPTSIEPHSNNAVQPDTSSGVVIPSHVGSTNSAQPTFKLIIRGVDPIGRKRYNVGAGILCVYSAFSNHNRRFACGGI